MMDTLLKEISRCTACSEALPHPPRPVLSFSAHSKIIIVGQAPGAVVNQTGIPWADKSGDNLRQWLGVTKESFYNTTHFGLIPIGFCYPGKGKTGDLPPRPECAPLWHDRIQQQLEHVELTILIGQYAQHYYLKERNQMTLTDTVRNFQAYLPEIFVLPHPSPRNNIWRARNQWFDEEVLPTLREKVAKILS